MSHAAALRSDEMNLRIVFSSSSGSLLVWREAATPGRTAGGRFGDQSHGCWHDSTSQAGNNFRSILSLISAPPVKSGTWQQLISRVQYGRRLKLACNHRQANAQKPFELSREPANDFENRPMHSCADQKQRGCHEQNRCLGKRAPVSRHRFAVSSDCGVPSCSEMDAPGAGLRV